MAQTGEIWRAMTMFGAAAALSTTALGAPAPDGDLAGKSVVLVHGAFADGSSWSKVIPMLEAKGLQVIAVQNPLTSLDDDVAAADRAIERAKGPVILVGHSWGGVVISEAGNDPKVKALVYVAAFAPDAGQSIATMTAGAPPPSYAPFLQQDSGHFLTLTDEGIRKNFAQDLPAGEASLVAAAQGPWAARCITDPVKTAAWRSKPAWYVLASADGMIPAAFQDQMASAMKAKVTRVSASHVAMLSQPKDVADTIIKAAKAAR